MKSEMSCLGLCRGSGEDRSTDPLISSSPRRQTGNSCDVCDCSRGLVGSQRCTFSFPSLDMHVCMYLRLPSPTMLYFFTRELDVYYYMYTMYCTYILYIDNIIYIIRIVVQEWMM